MHGDALDDAGIVHQDIDLADFGMDGIHQFLHGYLVRDVTHIAVHVGDAGGFVGLQALFHGCLVGRVEDDVLHAGLHESLGNGKANPISRTGYPGILAF